jgi:hypothetical protein
MIRRWSPAIPITTSVTAPPPPPLVTSLLGTPPACHLRLLHSGRFCGTNRSGENSLLFASLRSA